MNVIKRKFFHWVANQKISVLWCSMGTTPARSVEKIIPFEGDLKVFSFDQEKISLFNCLKDFSLYSLLHLFPIHQSMAGNPDEKRPVNRESLLKT